MATKKRKLRLSAAERKRRSLQAKRNFGLTKKRSRSRRRSTKRKTLNRSTTLRKPMAKKRRRSSKGGFLRSTAGKALLGGAIVAIAEPVIDQTLARFGVKLGDDMVKVGVGVGLAMWKKAPPMVRAGGAALAVIGTRNLVASQTGKLFGGSQ